MKYFGRKNDSTMADQGFLISDYLENTEASVIWTINKIRSERKPSFCFRHIEWAIQHTS